MKRTIAQGGLLRGMALALATGARHLMIEESTRLKPRPKAVKPKVYHDRAGMPHGTPGCKMIRKAMVGTLTIQGSRRGFLSTWSSTKVASMGLGDRRRAKG